MIVKMFRSKNTINNPSQVRDILIEHLEDIKENIKNKEPIDDLIKQISKNEISITELIEAYKQLINLSYQSINDESLRYKRLGILPIAPVKSEIIQKIKELIKE
ncbi:MAG: hypothetical protein ABIM30_00165 [candidate division WOR-3 bacterium]